MAQAVERVKIAVTGELPPRKARRINTGGQSEPSDWGGLERSRKPGRLKVPLPYTLVPTDADSAFLSLSPILLDP